MTEESDSPVSSHTFDSDSSFDSIKFAKKALQKSKKIMLNKPEVPDLLELLQ
jgi:hypothetical protein